MSQFHAISAMSLCLASILVIISMFMSYRQELKLEKDIFISALRATIQLFAIGFILAYIFSTESPIFIIGLLGLWLLMQPIILLNAAREYHMHCGFLGLP